MKKLLLLAYIILSGGMLFSQIDSTILYDAILSGGYIANTIRPAPWFGTIPNEVSTGIVTALFSFLYGLFYRKREIKKLKKNGKLTD